LLYSEIILYKDQGIDIRKLDNKNQKLVIGENERYFAHFKKFLDKNKNYENIFIESDIPKGEKTRLDIIIKGFLYKLKEYIKEDLKFLNKNKEEAKWVITAPCLWNDDGKKYLKKLAKEVDMNNIEIILEPEADSLAIFYDKYINKKYLSIGTKYLIVDAGGYTVDVSLNEILKNNDIKQLVQPKSYRLGSNFINEKIIEIIQEIYGEENIKNFTKTNSSEWEKILNIIEDSKNNINLIESENIKLNIELDKLICYEEGKGIWSSSKKAKNLCSTIKKDINITYSNKELYLPIKLIKKIISNLSSKIVSKINKYMSGMNFNLLVLTGGFSNSQILREKIKNNFHGKNIKIEILKSPQETVMRGAAIYGLAPNQILYRVSPVSIMTDNYENKKENEKCEFEEKKDKNGELKCLKYFGFIKIFETFKTGQIIPKIVKPISDEITIYYSDENEINSENIHPLATMEIPYSDLPLKERNIMVIMNFTNYIKVTIRDVDSNKENSEIIYYPNQKDEDDEKLLF